MRLTRADKSVLSDWWFTVDRLMFFGLLLLMGAGLVLSLAASPPIAAKYHLEAFLFRAPASGFAVARDRHHVLGIDPHAQADQAREPGDLRGRHRAHGADSRPWPRDQGRQALAADRLPHHPAVRVRQARLHRADGVALQREPEASRYSRHPACRGALCHLRRAADPPAGFRPDASGHAGVGRAVLYGGHQYGVDRRAGACRRRRHRHRLSARAACRLAHRPLLRSRVRRHLSDRPLAQFLPAWRLVRTGPWRGHGEERAARLAHRFHLRGDRRRIRADRLPHPAHSVRLHRAARSLESLAGTRRFHSPCHSRPHHAVRPSGAHQHGGECRVAPRQGHDAALHLLWRLLAARHGADHGLFARADPQAPDGGASQARRRRAVRRRAAPVREQAA